MGIVIVECPNCGKKNRVPAAAEGRPRCASCKQDLPWIAEAGESDFTEVVERSRVPVVIDLWAPWCGPCRMISPALEEVARRRKGRIKLVKVNVDEHPGVSARFGVQGIPTLLLFRNGQLVDRSVGARSTDALQTWIDEALGIAA
ncbi:MAG: thioredoxin [Acidimicrobiia bacterium]